VLFKSYSSPQSYKVGTLSIVALSFYRRRNRSSEKLPSWSRPDSPAHGFPLSSPYSPAVLALGVTPLPVGSVLIRPDTPQSSLRADCLSGSLFTDLCFFLLL
jgi:hypothetical protein